MENGGFCRSGDGELAGYLLRSVEEGGFEKPGWFCRVAICRGRRMGYVAGLIGPMGLFAPEFGITTPLGSFQRGTPFFPVSPLLLESPLFFFFYKCSVSPFLKGQGFPMGPTF